VTAALSVSDVRSGYGATEIIRGVSFDVERGESYILVGKNGAGKTTLIKTILGVIRANSGTVRLFDEDITRQPAYKIAGRTVGYAPQENAIFPDLTVGENLKLGAVKLSKDAFKERTDHVAELFPFLRKRMHQQAGTLSGGEQKMLLVARALLPAPRAVFLDEVSEGLQPSVVDRIADALVAERDASQLTLFVVEQHIDFVMRLATRYALVERGAFTGSGSMSEPGVESTLERHLAV
jgi:branched-chain amino acid transport system ATP-binding protein